MIRVHDVAETVRALRAADAVVRGTPEALETCRFPGPPDERRAGAQRQTPRIGRGSDTARSGAATGEGRHRAQTCPLPRSRHPIVALSRSLPNSLGAAPPLSPDVGSAIFTTDTAWVSLGTNVGHRGRNLSRLRDALATDGVTIVSASPEILTRPVGVTAQGDFHNQVVQLRSPAPWSPERWLDALQECRDRRGTTAHLPMGTADRRRGHPDARRARRDPRGGTGADGAASGDRRPAIRAGSARSGRLRARPQISRHELCRVTPLDREAVRQLRHELERGVDLLGERGQVRLLLEIEEPGVLGGELLDQRRRPEDGDPHVDAWLVVL